MGERTPTWLPPWEAGVAGLAGLAILSAGVLFHLRFSPHDPTLASLLEQPLAWTLAAAVPLLASLGWMLGDRRRVLVRALQSWQAQTEEGMRSLAQREWLTRGILQTAFDAVLVLDDDEVILDANPAASRIFGWPMEKLVGSEVSKVLPQHRRLGTTLAIERRTAGGEVLGREWQTHARHRAGHSFPVDLNMVALKEPDLLLYVVREATTRVEGEARRIAAARAELIDHTTAARRARSGQLLQLAAVLSAATHALLSDAPPPVDAPVPPRRTAIDLAFGVERLQELSMWERGSRSVTTSVVLLPALAHQIADILRPLAKACGHELRVVVDDDVTEVETDALRLSAAVRALMVRGLERSEGGVVELSVVREPRRHDDWIALHVRDTGPRLDDDELAAVYAMLGTDASSWVEPPGESLGLPLAHRLALALGGHLSVASHGTDGTTYTLRIPAAAIAERVSSGRRPVRLATPTDNDS